MSTCWPLLLIQFYQGGSWNSMLSTCILPMPWKNSHGMLILIWQLGWALVLVLVTTCEAICSCQHAICACSWIPPVFLILSLPGPCPQCLPSTYPQNTAARYQHQAPSLLHGWPCDWFLQGECLFRISSISSEGTKYCYVMSSLNVETTSWASLFFSQLKMHSAERFLAQTHPAF